MDQNPILVQSARKRSFEIKPREPLFLFHDGGGTSFSYFLLGQLDRDVYGISNPHFGTNEKWENGIESMATAYIKLIREVLPKGEILVGGWSLGGLTAIQVARYLANDPDLKVKGIVMMDSFYPIKGPQKPRKGKWGAHTTEQMVQKLTMTMDEALRMIGIWDAPIWQDQNSLPTPPSSEPTSPLEPSVIPVPCPPAILIRATEEDSDVTTEPSEKFQELSKTKSGFVRYPSFNLVDVVETKGDHFTIFADTNVDGLTQKLKSACDKLTKMDWKPTPDPLMSA